MHQAHFFLFLTESPVDYERSSSFIPSTSTEPVSWSLCALIYKRRKTERAISLDRENTRYENDVDSKKPTTSLMYLSFTSNIRQVYIISNDQQQAKHC